MKQRYHLLGFLCSTAGCAILILFATQHCSEGHSTNTRETRKEAHEHISGVSGKLFSGEKIRAFFPPSITSEANLIGSSAFVSVEKYTCKGWAVCTTIFEVSEAVLDVCERLQDYCLVVVADKKGFDQYSVHGGCTFVNLSVRAQEEIATLSSFAAQTPWNHFGRKNLGYLFAIANGAEAVWDFDDDNILISSDYLTGTPEEYEMVTLNTTMPYINPYPLLGADKFSWPRGLPLEGINNPETLPRAEALVDATIDYDRIGVVQSLANIDPDVDAIYRLQRELPFKFNGWSQAAKTFVVPQSLFIPFNAQATLFRSRRSLWALYLPISVHGRVADIWRSYIVETLFRNTCIHVAYAVEPLVNQNRNPHTYLADFDAEQDLYYKSGRLLEFLNEWDPATHTLPEQVVELYVRLYERDYVGLSDVNMVKLWLDELDRLSYTYPSNC